MNDQGTVPDTMRAVLLNGHGGPEKLEYREDVPVPIPGSGDVLVAVSACGVNNTDINTRIGWYAVGDIEAGGDDGSWSGQMGFPRIQGAEPVGRVATVGSGVDHGLIGKRVMVDPWIRDPGGRLDLARYLGSELDGGFAEFVRVPAVNTHPVEVEVPSVEIAGLACSYATAEHMLHRARVRAGQIVLVTGASGGVGTGLVQLAKRRGAVVLAVTSGSKLEAVRALGADRVFDRSEPALEEAIAEATGANGVDVVADVVGGPAFGGLFELIRRGGHYVTSGAIAGPIVSLDLRTLYLNDITMHGATVVPESVFEDLVSYVRAGEIRNPVAATYPLHELARAQEQFLRKQHVGSLVIEIDR